MRWINLPNHSIARSSLAGSFALTQAVLAAHPELENTLPDPTYSPEKEPVVVLKDPIRRFHEIAQILGWKGNLQLNRPEFQPVTQEIAGVANPKIFLFETQLEEARAYLGLEPVNVETIPPSVPLDPEQEQEVRGFYREDFELYHHLLGMPVLSTPSQGVRVWTSLQFVERLTDLEKVAIFTSTDVQVIVFRTMAIAALEVRSDDPRTLAGLDYLVSVGLLTPERKIELLTA